MEETLPNQKKRKGFHIFHFSQEINQGIHNIGYKNPTPIQKKVIPEIISGFNIIAHSRTGSGKTAAFLLPTLHKLKSHSQIVGARCLILSPVREISYQTAMFCRKLGKFTDLKYALISGGKSFDEQFEKLAMNPDIIIATPGRVLHHIEEGSLQLKKIEIVIIDEADKMMELNFGENLKKIIKFCPSKAQIILLSATIQEKLAMFLKSGLIKEYKILNIDEENKIPEKLKIHIIYTRNDEKVYTLVSLFIDNNNENNSIINLDKELTICFVMTKYHCDYLQEFLKYYNIQSLIIYGSMSQEIRNKNLEDFKKGKIKLLIVTDVAARGLDIPFLDNVINFNFPESAQLFVHRVGRTARAGRSGRNFNLVCFDELPYFFDIKFYLGKQFLMSNNYENNIDNNNENNINNNINNENNNNDNNNNDIENYNTISFGSIPNHLINSIKERKIDYLFNSKFDIEELYTKMIRAEKKGLSFHSKPSLFSVEQAKNLVNDFNIKYHPFYYKNQNEDEENKLKFLNDLHNYKPKENYFEKIRETSVDINIINEFKKKTKLYQKHKQIEKEKNLLKQKIQIEKENKLFNNNDNNDNNNNNEKNFLSKKIKRSQIKSFKNPLQYISNSKEENKNLWGNEKPLKLDELTLNINTDDTLQTHNKTIWDSKKKTFVKEKIDNLGNKIVRNDLGKNVKKNEKFHPYKNWKKKFKTSLQNVGEIEIKNNINSAKERLKQKKFNNNNIKNNNKNEIKNLQQIIKEKKKKFKNEQKKNKLFSKKKFKENLLKNTVHLNSKKQTFFKRKVNRFKRKK